MKIVCGILAALGLAGALFIAGVTVGDGDVGFGDEVEKLSMAEMLQRLEAAIPSLTNPVPDEFSEFPKLYAKACQRATGAEVDELARLLGAVPPGEVSYWFDECFSAYASARIRQRVRELEKKPLRLKWVSASEPTPKELADAPANLQEAWKLHRDVVAPYQALMNPIETGEARKVSELQVDLRRLLGKAEPRAWERIAAHTWGHWCGTGSGSLYHPRNRGILLSLIEDGKWQEAAGAMLDQVPLGFGSSAEDSNSLAAEFLAALGLDWEQVLLGSMLPVTARNMGNGRPVVLRSFREVDPWSHLAAQGSEKVVRQCLELIRWQNLDPRDACSFLAAALGPEPREEGDFVFSSHPAPVRKAALSDACRKEIASVFADYLASTNRSSDLIDAINEVDAHFIRDLREPLAKLMAHPIHRVADSAHKQLLAAGLTTGREEIAPATPPLRFRLLLNGEPLSGLKVEMSAVALRPEGAKGASPVALGSDVTIVTNGEGESQEPHFVRELASRKERTSDGKGEVEYRLDDALAPERIGAVQLRIGPSEMSELGNPLEFLGEKKADPDSVWPGPWIVHQVGVRAGDKQVQEIRLAAGELEVKVSGFEGLTSERVEVVLRRVHSGKPFSLERGLAKVSVAIGEAGSFQRLQPGRYKVSMQAPGAANYESGEITVSEAAVTKLDAQLEPGRSVRGTVILLDGSKSELPYFARLYREGVELSGPRGKEWNGLAFGKYTARIASTREYEAEMKQRGLPPGRIAKEKRTEGAEVSFVIDSSTPPTLDIGEVRSIPEKP